MRIPLRTFQRNVQALLDTMAVNSAPWAEVVDGGGKVLFLAALPEVIEAIGRQNKRASDGDMSAVAFAHASGETQVATTVGGTMCDKCKKLSECRKWMEDGSDYKICAVCALKAKLPWHKLEKL